MEYNTNTISNGVAKDVCTQLRVANSQLQTRSWTPNGTAYVAGSLSAWRMLSNNVTNGTVAASTPPLPDQPFVVPTANTAATSAYQQLTVTVIATSENAGLPEPNRVSVTYVAVNSTAAASTSICQQLAVDATS